MLYTPFERIHMIPPGFQYNTISPENYPTIMHLVLFSHNDEYNEMYEITKQYYKKYYDPAGYGSLNNTLANAEKFAPL